MCSSYRGRINNQILGAKGLRDLKKVFKTVSWKLNKKKIWSVITTLGFHTLFCHIIGTVKEKLSFCKNSEFVFDWLPTASILAIDYHIALIFLQVRSLLKEYLYRKLTVGQFSLVLTTWVWKSKHFFHMHRCMWLNSLIPTFVVHNFVDRVTIGSSWFSLYSDWPLQVVT